MDLAEVEFSVNNLQQFIPEYEEINIQDIMKFDSRAFQVFGDESK